jgi:hypothetical protein
VPFDREAEYRQNLDHLVDLASDPDWKAYAWARAKELDGGQSGLFRGIAHDLTQAMWAMQNADLP